jgi:uncharacterized membrane protein YgcG
MRSLRRLTLIALGWALWLALPVRAGALPESIQYFSSQITVLTNGALVVTERIVVQAGRDRIQHGIYRDFPQLYRGLLGLNVRTGFAVLEARRDGVPEPYLTANRDNGVRVYLGSPSVMLSPGVYTYELTYKTDRQLGFFGDHDELYWNVTGNGWVFPIEAAVATVILPAGAPVKQMTAYTGAQGARGTDFTERLENGNAHFETTRTLNPSEGLSLVVSWPKGFVAAPSALAKWVYLIEDNRAVVIGLAGVLAAFIYFFIAWLAVGRDPKPGTIIPLYGPPAGFSPAAVRYLAKMGFDDRAFAAAIMNLAVKGKLKINEDEDKSYVLLAQDRSPDGLALEEQKLLGNLFSGGERILSLQNENYETINQAKADLTSDLSDMEEENYFHSNILYWVPGALLTLGAGLWAGVSAHGPALPLATMIWLGALALAAIVLNVAFHYLLKAPTQAGRQYLDQIEGFRMYLSVAEKDRLNLENPPERTPALFEKFLPYALALGVEQKWSEQFAAVLAAAGVGGTAYAPGWYSGNAWSHCGSHSFASAFGNSLAGAISSASVAPGSSSGFGGGGGGGGGGGSGGGGGGGGGGGW